MTAVPAPNERWEAGERLFRGDQRWIGGDDAYSIPLGDDRRLWLFGDTFIARTPGSGREDAHFINNSIAIQHGSAAGAEMEFVWGGTRDAPDSFFGPPPGGRGVYRWPGHGVLVDDTLLLFFMLVRDVATPPDDIETLTFFEVVGWDAVTVDARTHPRHWTPRDVALPHVPFARLVGNGGVFADGRFVHVHAWQDGTVHLARWTPTQVVRGDLREPQWWCGSAGWLAPGAVGFEPVPTLSGVETEFTVHWEPRIDRFVHTQLPGLGEGRLELRTAPNPHGPWSEPTVAYRPEAEHRAFCYAGKAHPGLAPDGLAVTFNSIPFTLAAIRERPELYLPRVVRVGSDTVDNLL